MIYIAKIALSAKKVVRLRWFFFSSRRRHTRWNCDWSSDVCSSDLLSATHPAAASPSIAIRSAPEGGAYSPGKPAISCRGILTSGRAPYSTNSPRAASMASRDLAWPILIIGSLLHTVSMLRKSVMVERLRITGGRTCLRPICAGVLAAANSLARRSLRLRRPLRGNPLHLESCAEKQWPRSDERAGREVFLKVRAVNRVESLKQGNIRAEYLHVHQIAHRAAAA